MVLCTVMQRFRGRMHMRFAIYFALVVAGAIGGELLSKLFLPRQSPTYTMHEGYIWLVAVVFSLVAGSIALFINFSWVRLAQSKRDVERAERAAIEAQFSERCRLQIEPHLSLQYLGESRCPDCHSGCRCMARCLLGNLIRYLRAALTHARSEAATLQTEVELLKAYLAIMGLRLPNRLTTEFDCDPDCLRLKFPAMLLQPLVENAITHGIEPAGDGGSIRVTVRCADDKLLVSVDDTGVGLGNATNAGTGAGIQNVRARLQSLFGSAAHLVLEPLMPRGTHASIEVPLNLLSQTGCMKKHAVLSYIIAEDEPLLARVLAQQLNEHWPAARCAAIAANGAEALKLADEFSPDVAFLDVRMPQLDGLEAARQLCLKEHPPLIVFVTAYDAYARSMPSKPPRSTTCSSPVEVARLTKCVERLSSQLSRGSGSGGGGSGEDAAGEMAARIAELLGSSAPRKDKLRFVRAGAGTTVKLIPVNEVLWFEAEDKYITVATRDGDSIIRMLLRGTPRATSTRRFSGRFTGARWSTRRTSPTRSAMNSGI